MLDKVNSNIWRRGYIRVIVLGCLTLLTGCASSVVVKPDIPNPLVQKLPLNTSLVYSDSFKDYVYLETEKKRGSLKSIDFTEAQTTMFEQVFSSVTNLVGADDASRNLTIEPEILDFQYSSPTETKLKQYEVWIKYRLKLRNVDGARIADWTVKGYGKTPTGLLTTASSAFNAATNVALRDVGAQLSIRFPRQRVVKTLLDGGAPPAIPDVDTEAEENVEVAVADVSSDSSQTGEVQSFVEGESAAQPESQSDTEAVDEVDVESDDNTNTEVSDEV